MLSTVSVENWDASPRMLTLEVSVPFWAIKKTIYRKEAQGRWEWFTSSEGWTTVLPEISREANELVTNHLVLSRFCSIYGIYDNRPKPPVPADVEPSLNKVLKDNEDYV